MSQDKEDGNLARMEPVSLTGCLTECSINADVAAADMRQHCSSIYTVIVVKQPVLSEMQPAGALFT